MLAPASASPMAMDLPIPLLQPVTRAVFPLKLKRLLINSADPSYVNN
jgi:hypothetical protein